MPVREAPDRRGRIVRGSSGLLERESALHTIDFVLDEARHGTGGALLIEGHAGIGKTRLHEAALDRARGWEMQVLRAAGAELERNIAFGMASQLLGAQPSELPEHDGETQIAPDDASLTHALFTRLAAERENSSALIAVDDLHWCDTASLEFLLYLLHRLEELPIAIVITRRPGMGNGATAALDRIAGDPRVRVERLAPLGHDSVRELARKALGPRVNVAVTDACQRATSGNPFYLHELLLALREDEGLSSDELARHALALAPDAVTRTLRVRVGRLGRPAAALARATAILGDDVQLRHAAVLAGLTVNEAAASADALAAVEVLLAREPLRFVHPLVRHSIDQDIPASERASRHLEAARLLHGDGESSEQVAAHLLLGRAQGDGWVVEQLQAAARDARARGAAPSAVGYLRRALQEPPAGELRVAVLAELGAAEAASGEPRAAEHFELAAALTSDPLLRARLMLERGHALAAQGLHRLAVDVYDAGVASLSLDAGDPEAQELHDALQTGFVGTALMIPALHEVAAARSDTLLERATEGPLTQGRRMLFAQAAMRRLWAGAPAPEIVALAEQAWDDGRLLEHETADGIAWLLVATALTWSGELERAVDVATDAIEDARRRGSALALATAGYARSAPYLLQGRVRDAITDLDLARDARRYGWRQFRRAAAALYCLCLIETGELDRAEEVLLEDGPVAAPEDVEDLLRLSARSALRLAQGQPKQALEDATAAGRALQSTIRGVELVPWRAIAAQAALANGDRAQARELALEYCALAERVEVLHARIRAYRVFGLTEERARGVAALRTAVELSRGVPQRLETIRALVEFGAALRRANQRAASRRPLQVAADRAKRDGATVLYTRARTELAASGARPRRDAFLSGPDSLTPSERRIVELAAAGRSNREIAQTLFVTGKTVEYHLRNAYRKLEIEGRAELVRALAE